MLITNAAMFVKTDNDLPAQKPEAVYIENGRIAELGTSLVLSAKYPHESSLDAGGMLLVPGFINAHSRMSHILGRGHRLPPLDRIAAGGEVTEYWRRYDNAVDYETIRYSVLVSALEAVRFGTTLVFDLLSAPNAIPFALDAVAEAALEVGIRVNAAYAVSDHNGVDQGRKAVDENSRFTRRAKDEALLSAAMGLDTCHYISNTNLSYAVGAAGIAQVGFHGVVGESLYAGRDCASSYGMSPTARMRRWGVLSKRTLLADGIYLDPKDREYLVQSGTWLSHNPRASAFAGAGTARVLDYLEEGLSVCLGTDGYTYDMPAEVSSAMYAQLQTRQLDPERGTATFMSMLTDTNARMAAAMLNEPVGTLRVGALADLVLLEVFNPMPDEQLEFQRQLVFGSSGLRVDSVLVNGRILYRHGQYQTVDAEKIVAHAQQVAHELWSRL